MKHRLRPEPDARVKVAIVTASVVAVSVVAACGWWQARSAGPDTAPNTGPAPIVVATSHQVAPDVLLSPPPTEIPSAAFDALALEMNAHVGLAFAPLDRPDQVTSLGTWVGGPAWSTIKVPLALALLREEGGGTVTPAVRSAITASDNTAAQSMWETLGGGETAAGKVEEVLSDGGNPHTDVPSTVRRPGFSVFGQTDWRLSDQARFLAHLACDPGASPVLALMGEIVSGQRWGLGALDGAHFKGGWGPGTDGSYLVRQYGVVRTESGQVAVAVAAVADSGSFGDGTWVLNRVAEWLQDHGDDVGGGQCPVG